MRWSYLILLALIILLFSGCARPMSAPASPSAPASAPAPPSVPVPAESPREAEKVFQRVYPEVIKGNWEPSSFHMKRLMEEEVDNLKNLGVNTVSISVEHEFRQDGSYFVRGEEMIQKNLRLAKENGFAVLVAPNFVGAAGHNFQEEGIKMTKEDYLGISREVALRWAKIAEEDKVEFFAPQNEFNFMMRNFAEKDSEVAEITAAWHKGILPEIRGVFAGKVMAKLAGITEEIDVTGYDYVGITIFHRLQSLEAFRTLVKGQYSILASMARKSDARWLVSEAVFPFGGLFSPYITNAEGRSLDELQADYFRISIEEYLQFAEDKPAGYIFIAWIMPSMEVKDRPAEKVLRGFFSQI